MKPYTHTILVSHIYHPGTRHPDEYTILVSHTCYPGTRYPDEQTILVSHTCHPSTRYPDEYTILVSHTCYPGTRYPDEHTILMLQHTILMLRSPRIRRSLLLQLFRYTSASYLSLLIVIPIQTPGLYPNIQGYTSFHRSYIAFFILQI